MEHQSAHATPCPRREAPPRRLLDRFRLHAENARFEGTGGTSAAAGPLGFRPAFLDTLTDTVYLSRFASGAPAPCHVLDGLPDEVVLARGDGGRVTAAKASLVSGFVFDGRFYDRDAAARVLAAA